MDIDVKVDYGSRDKSGSVTRLPITDQLVEASFVLAVTSCCVNIVVSIVLWNNKLKTHHKFVLSLMLSDFLLSLCHVVMKFREFPTHWTAPKFIMTLWQTFNGTTTILSRTEMRAVSANDVSLFAFQNLAEIVQESPIMLSSSEIFLVNDSKQLNGEGFNSTDSQWMKDMFANNDSIRALLGSQGSSIDSLKMNLSTSYSTSMYNITDKILGSLYLIPNMTAPLAVWFITLSVLISVHKPLHVNIILSKRRGNLLIFTIWGLSAVVAGTVFGLTYNRKTFAVATIINNTFILIWYGTLVCFVTIPLQYITVITIICRGKFRNQARSNPYYKAAVTAFVVSLAYATCNLPFIWIYTFSSQEIRVDLYTAIFQIMFMLSTIFDPVIYAIRLPEVKSGFKDILNKVKRFSYD